MENGENRPHRFLIAVRNRPDSPYQLGDIERAIGKIGSIFAKYFHDDGTHIQLIDPNLSYRYKGFEDDPLKNHIIIPNGKEVYLSGALRLSFRTLIRNPEQITNYRLFPAYQPWNREDSLTHIRVQIMRIRNQIGDQFLYRQSGEIIYRYISTIRGQGLMLKVNDSEAV